MEGKNIVKSFAWYNFQRPDSSEPEITMINLQATHRPSTFEFIWSIVSSFFRSLIPENPGPMNANWFRLDPDLFSLHKLVNTSPSTHCILKWIGSRNIEFSKLQFLTQNLLLSEAAMFHRLMHGSIFDFNAMGYSGIIQSNDRILRLVADSLFHEKMDHWFRDAS